MISPGPDKQALDRSYTASSEHTTAADMSPHRQSDGHVSSGEYAERLAVGRGAADDPLDINFHHPLEKWLGRREFRWLLKKLTDSSGSTSGTAATTAQLQAQNDKMQGLTEKVGSLHLAMYGNGRSDDGVIMQVQKLRWGASLSTKFFWLFIGALISVLAYAFREQI